MPSIAEALAATHGTLPAGEARLLLAHVVRKPAAWLLAHADEPLPAEARKAFQTLAARRAAGEPVAYLLRRREFYGREFSVSPAVLIPRPETELLVEISLEKVGAGTTATILDLGTGSGCIALTLALERPQAHVTAVDASPAALAVAQENARRLGAGERGAGVRFLLSNWFAALQSERFDLIVGNPPYIAAADPHLGQGDLRHEPSAALASGEDGLEALSKIITAAPAHLVPGGSLWLEHGYDQAAALRALLGAAGFTAIEQHMDLAGIVRVSGGTLK
jgi:release factor glutamine methyltransferase